ncbi:MAG: hypothetical protein R3293_19730 [Candidatus Promineifilaceae bacterium]|nr:hypothetical protein [Candidatus Promineifilaceae bacterium]
MKNVTTNEERHFATVNAAIDFLLQELDVNRDDSPDDANQE